MSWFVRSEHKQKIYSNAFRIRIFLFFSFSFEIDTKNTFIRSHCSLENHSRFQRKIYTRFQTKKVKNQTLGDGTYLYGLYKGFFHPHPPGVLSNILFSASFMCLLRSPQLGTLLKDHYDQQETL